MGKVYLAKEGYRLAGCAGCGCLVRVLDGAAERGPYHWTAPCPACGRDLCLVCFPEKAAQCVACAGGTTR